MDSPEILTFSTPKVETPSVEAMPSPTFELAYAYYVLNRPDSHQKRLEMPWLGLLYEQHADLVERVRTFWPEGERESAGFDLFWLVADMGYARESPQRLLDDLAKLPSRFLKHLEAQRRKALEGCKDEARREKEGRKFEGPIKRFARLRQSGELRQGYVELLRRLWAILEPLWLKEGLEEARRASGLFQAKYRETGGVLEALPPHHFTQFEAAAEEIRASQKKGALIVVPLYFALGGGFDFDMADAHYIGYGIQSERFYEDLSAQVQAAAAHMKALADPTRLMLLTLIARYEDFAMTVSDLAKQLGVSQPTASGHLKQLKEAGLITLEKRGNKSFHKVNAPALEATLDGLRKLLLQSK
jgi:ArsR family transcriptional regulator